MDEKVFEISSKSVTMEVKDDRTGRVFRRELPLER